MTFPPPPGQLPPPSGDPQFPPAGYGAPYPPAYPPQYPAGYPLYGPGYPAYPVPGAPPRVTTPVIGWVLVGLAVLAIVAATMPWATLKAFGLSASVSGTDGGDGVLTIVCASVVAASGLAIGLAHGRLWASITACVFASFIVLIGVVDLADVARLTSGDAFGMGGVSVGAGLVLTVIAGAVLVLASIVAMVRRSAPPS